jgi:hypothetical protein
VKVILILGLLFPITTHSQTILLNAGDSTLYESTGGSIKLYNPDGSVMTFGAGTVNSGPMMFGGNVTRPFNGFTTSAGDLSLGFSLPTDFAQGYGFLSRGFLIKPPEAGTRKYGPYQPLKGGLIGALAGTVSEIFAHCALFGGVSSAGLGTPFFQATQASQPLGYVHCKDRLTSHLSLSTRGAFSDRQTALASLTWTSSQWVLAGTGGIGNNTPYGAVLAKFENTAKTVSIKADYVSAQSDFRRVLVTAPLISENIGLNADGTWLILKSLRVTGSHQHLLSPVLNAPGITATMNSEGIFYQLRNMNFHAADYSSTALGIKNNGRDFGSDVRLIGGVSVRGQYLQSKNSEIFIGSVRERFRHLEFTENYARTSSVSNGQTYTSSSFDGGVSWKGNGFNADLQYTEMYFPFVPARQSPFKRVLSVSFSKAIQDATISVQSFVNTQNQMKWTVSGSDYLYGKSVDSERHLGPSHKSLGRYVVRGIVTDTEGNPVFGALLQIDGQEVYSSPTGEFFMRWSQPGTFPICVVTPKFLSGDWRLVSAPATATARLEDQADFIQIMVQRQ